MHQVEVVLLVVVFKVVAVAVLEDIEIHTHEKLLVAAEVQSQL